MAETLFLPQAGSKEEIYQALLPQVEALISGEQDLVANLANIAAALREAFGFFWVGFYVVQGRNWYLAPFKDLLPAPELDTDGASAERPGRKRKPSWSPMWRRFQDTLPAVPLPNLKLWYLHFRTEKYFSSWMWIAILWMILMG